MFMKYAVRAGWSAFVVLAPFAAQAQAGLSPDVVEKLKNLQNIRIKSPAGGEAKGWTCREEDGRRLHRVDPTNVAHMGKVPSSVAGLRDNSTPAERLPACTEPR